MQRTNNAFSLLQAVAVIGIIAITLWSIGVPTLRFAEAANVTFLSNTLSTSASSTPANHTITFVTPTGMTDDDTLSITFGAGFNADGSIDNLDSGDFDMTIDGVEQNLVDVAGTSTSFQVIPSGTTIDFVSEAGGPTIGANATVTIEIGTNATHGSTSDEQITNPQGGQYDIDIQVGTGGDTGTTIVTILDEVTVTASVDTVFNFSVNGVVYDQPVNGGTTTGPTTATEIDFGELTGGTASTAAQDLTVSTNASNGFTVTVEVNHQLLSSTGADIDGFSEGSFTVAPGSLWAAPNPSLGDDDTYGHWGLTTTDDDVITTENFYISASTTPVTIFTNDGPSNGSGDGVGTARIGYRVQITDLQEAADDYTATLTYVATPVF